MNTHNQIKISQGVYVSDFRKNGELKGVSQPVQSQIKDLGLLLDKISNNESKIKQLIYSNEAMEEEPDWQQQPDFVEAIEENFEIMLKFSSEMKEWIVQLYTLNYQPENQNMQQLTNANRIAEREQTIKEMRKKFMQVTAKHQQQQAIQIQEEDQGVSL